MNSKRWFDLGLAIAALGFFTPFMIVIASLILILDGRPILFTQQRLGKDKKSFTVYKFRTMDDGKVTRLGQWLRATGLDEIPQFVNVLKGDMSIVGPRPLTQQDVERLGWFYSGAAFRWQVLPGITGLAQIFSGQGVRMSRYMDRIYIRRKSIYYDCQIITISFMINIIGKQRVRSSLYKRERR